MKVVQLNAFCGYGSTGKIVVDISKELTNQGIENYIFYSCRKSEYKLGIKYTNDIDIKTNALASRIIGNYGFDGTFKTKFLIRRLKQINPDIIHIHNIHSHDVNYKLLFDYIKSENIKVVWTLHDCWAFTGYCTHFDYIKCNKWKNECSECPQARTYSWFFDRSKSNYNKKKNAVENVKNLIVVTPSDWLGKITKQSFLGKFDVKTIYNGIDLEVFKPMPDKIREKYNIKSKYIVMAVALLWTERKGLKFVIRLAELLDDRFTIIMVGKTTEEISSERIIHIDKTENQIELAELYSAADVFVNCTLEDNFPTVNIEAIACGTPTITFNTGGSGEIIDEKTGKVVSQGAVEEMAIEIVNKVENKTMSCDNCRRRAEQVFNKKISGKKYIELYKSICRG